MRGLYAFQRIVTEQLGILAVNSSPGEYLDDPILYVETLLSTHVTRNRPRLMTWRPHHMPEWFPDPERFDIERYTPERAEHRRKGVYAPFGIGGHQCLGRSLAEALIAINVATVVHEAELALSPRDYELKTRLAPTLLPHDSFRFRIVRRRSPPRMRWC